MMLELQYKAFELLQVLLEETNKSSKDVAYSIYKDLRVKEVVWRMKEYYVSIYHYIYNIVTNVYILYHQNNSCALFKFAHTTTQQN